MENNQMNDTSRLGAPKDVALYLTEDSIPPSPPRLTPERRLRRCVDSSVPAARILPGGEQRTLAKLSLLRDKSAGSISRLSLWRDLSGGSIGTIRSIDNYSDVFSADPLRRASLLRELSISSSICGEVEQIPPSMPPNSYEFLAQGGIGAFRTNDRTVPGSIAACSERGALCRWKQDYPEAGQNSGGHTGPPPGFTHMLLHGTPAVDSKDLADSNGSRLGSNVASSFPWMSHQVPYSAPRTNCFVSGPNIYTTNSYNDPSACPFPQKIDRETRFVTQPPMDPQYAAVPTEIVVVPSPPIARKEARNYVSPDDKIYVADGCRDTDVLLGRGEGNNRHHGHKLFHQEKLHFQEQYLNAPKKKVKSMVAEQFLSAMEMKYQSRFLGFCEEKKQWYVISHKRALEKAKQVLRENFTAEMRRAKQEKYSRRKKKQKRSV